MPSRGSLLGWTVRRYVVSRAPDNSAREMLTFHISIRKPFGGNHSVTIQRLPLAVIERSQPVRYPPHVQRQDVPLAGPKAPEVGDCNSFRHQWRTAHSG